MQTHCNLAWAEPLARLLAEEGLADIQDSMQAEVTLPYIIELPDG